MGQNEVEPLRLSPQQRIVAWRLSEGRLVDVDELIAALYDRHADGGPLTANMIAREMVYRLRGKMRRHGIEIINVRGHGWRVRIDHHERFRTLLADEVARNAPNGADILRDWSRLHAAPVHEEVPA